MYKQYPKKPLKFVSDEELKERIDNFLLLDRSWFGNWRNVFDELFLDNYRSQNELNQLKKRLANFMIITTVEKSKKLYFQII